MSVKKLEQILSDEYGKIVMGKSGAPIYCAEWIEESWARLLNHYGILYEEPSGPKTDWVQIAHHGTFIKSGVSSSFDDRTDCWIPLKLATLMLFAGKLVENHES